jgi:TPP-dependent 2-oxoacid decarboxylase
MENTTVGRYLIDRLGMAGLKHMFGVPGDYVLDFMDRIVDSDIELIGNCNELNAGYAADAYARLNGIGSVCVTYGVGGLSALNAASGAYAERVPLVVISGAPNSAQRLAQTHMHHISTDYDMQFDIYSKVTIDAAQLNDPLTAPDEIDRVISHCLSERLPVYLEIPVDIVDAPCRQPDALMSPYKHSSDISALDECVRETRTIMENAQNPVLLIGVEAFRFGLDSTLLRLVEKLQIPFMTTLDGKSVLPENHPLFAGLYMGALSRESVREHLENSDGLLCIGTMNTDVNTGGFTANLPERNIIRAHKHKIRIDKHFYLGVWMEDYLDALLDKLQPHHCSFTHPIDPYGPQGKFTANPDAPVQVARFYDRINRYIDRNTVVVAETGDALFATAELYIEDPENYISQSYYLSIGYALPATLGICLARPDKRVMLFQGDGSFQMTAQELSTLLRHNCNPVIFLLNNDGYVIERLIHDGPYNDIQQWNYHLLPKAFAGDAVSLEVKTEGELEDALQQATDNADKLIFINLHLPADKGSDALERLCNSLRALQTGSSRE